ncbi:MAG: hypothetical protein JXQ30_12910 [Spirochaetes bacterium]|nr:hypothetical protein [Spirochaetota bacterium]
MWKYEYDNLSDIAQCYHYGEEALKTIRKYLEDYNFVHTPLLKNDTPTYKVEVCNDLSSGGKIVFNFCGQTMYTKIEIRPADRESGSIPKNNCWACFIVWGSYDRNANYTENHAVEYQLIVESIDRKILVKPIRESPYGWPLNDNSHMSELIVKSISRCLPAEWQEEKSN